MNFLADECCDAGLVELLRADGHDVLYALEEQPGDSDDEVLRRAFKERRILLTEDKDFGELVYRLQKPASGIVLIRISVEDRHLKWPQLKKLLEMHGDCLFGAFVIVEVRKFRFRPLLFNTESPFGH